MWCETGPVLSKGQVSNTLVFGTSGDLCAGWRVSSLEE